MFRLSEDRAMREVREWKDECNASVEHLPRGEALRKRFGDALANTRAMGLFDPGQRKRRLPQEWNADRLLQSLETRADQG